MNTLRFSSSSLHPIMSSHTFINLYLLYKQSLEKTFIFPELVHVLSPVIDFGINVNELCLSAARWVFLLILSCLDTKLCRSFSSTIWLFLYCEMNHFLWRTMTCLKIPVLIYSHICSVWLYDSIYRRTNNIDRNPKGSSNSKYSDMFQRNKKRKSHN